MCTHETNNLKTPTDVTLHLGSLLVDALKMGAEREYSANHDTLTGLLNANGLEKALSESPEPVALLYLDSTRLKAVNDIIDHDRGDEAIIGTANVIKSSLRKDDLAARIGGDEFLVILNPESHKDKKVVRQPQEVLDAVITRIKEQTETFLDNNPDLVEKCGFEIAVGGVVKSDGMTIDSMRKKGEANMYAMKQKQHEISGTYR